MLDVEVDFKMLINWLNGRLEDYLVRRWKEFSGGWNGYVKLEIKS